MTRAPAKAQPIRTFEDLNVWKMGRAIRKKLYNLAQGLPEHERHNLASQIRRAAVSLTANLAEGYGRFHFKENIQCCRISRGSAFELRDLLIACNDQGYLSDDGCENLKRELSEFVKMLNGYIRSIGTMQPSSDA